MILESILADVQAGLAMRKGWMPLDDLRPLALVSETPCRFEAVLSRPGISIIAEIKRSSPSRGKLNPNIDVAKLVEAYARGGATAVSVLTEQYYFNGSLADLVKARRTSDIPLLRKDFIIDPYQVYEARTAGADGILLIAGILQPAQLHELIDLARSLGMSSLVEVHAEREVEKALIAGATLIGINNRNLADFSVDLETTLMLRPLIPQGVTVVSESGITCGADITLLQAAGIDAVLIGEALVRSAEPESRVRELIQQCTVEVKSGQG